MKKEFNQQSKQASIEGSTEARIQRLEMENEYLKNWMPSFKTRKNHQTVQSTSSRWMKAEIFSESTCKIR